MPAIFLGTPVAAVPSLTALADVDDIEVVVTQPDRRAGRGGQRSKSPVKVAAEQFGFKVEQPETKEDLLAVLTRTEFDVGLVVAYGRILTPAMLSTAPHGFLNVHFSLLPRWRGAAPVERAIAAGDERTGVTLMKIDDGLDTGPILGEIATPIAGDETGGGLTARLSFLGATLVDSSMPEYLNARRRPVPQLDTETTVASRLTKDEARLRPDTPASAAERMVRAFNPRPTAWLSTPEGTIRVHKAVLAAGTGTPGTVEATPGGVIAGFSTGGLRLVTVQPEGKAPMDAEGWMNGRRGEPTSFSA